MTGMSGSEEDEEEPNFDYPFDSTEKEQSPVECPDCGEEFKNNRGKNIHRGQAHR